MLKTFKDILIIKNGKNQKSVENPEGQYPIYGSGGIIGFANNYLCEGNTVVIGRKGSINNPIFVDKPFWNVDTAFGLVTDRSKMIPKYLYYFCLHFDFNRLNKAVTLPSLTKSDLLKIEIDVPDLVVQFKVADKLQKVELIINLKKQQLQKFDDLIRARFVEMFGNPITNNKNFVVKKVIEVVKLQRGHDLPIQNRIQNSTIPVWGSNGIVGYHNEAKSNSGIITGRSGTLGKVYYYAHPFWPLNTTLYSINTYNNNIIYLKYLLEFYELQRFASGTGVPTLNRNEFHNEIIIDVPLDLQNEFADFVKQVDKSKLAVQQSLDKTQELFDSLMQKYFG